MIKLFLGLGILFLFLAEELKNARRSNKSDYRKAYDNFGYLNAINTGYLDFRYKMAEAHAKGIDYIKVILINDSEKNYSSTFLEEELLNFDTYGLNNL